MLDFREELHLASNSIYDYIHKIDVIISIITEKINHRIIDENLLHQLIKIFFDDFENKDSNENKSIRIDSEFKLLKNIINKLNKETWRLIKLQDKLDEISDSTDGHHSSDRKNGLFFEIDPMDECVECLDEITSVISSSEEVGSMVLSNVYIIASEYAQFVEIDKVQDSVADYRESAIKAKDACCKCSDYIREYKKECNIACSALKQNAIKWGRKTAAFPGIRGDETTSVGYNKIIPPPRVDSVQFSAIAASRFEPGKYLPISIVIYEDAYRNIIDNLINTHGDDVKEVMGGYHDVERNSLVKVVLTSNDVTIDDCEEIQKWNGKYLNFEFAVKVPADYTDEQILLSATVYINDIVATRLKLILDCKKKNDRNISIKREDVVSAFVSYASQDRNLVAAIIQGMKKARPDMDIFFDIENLRSGQIWEDVLKNEIENRDVLFLCWSKSAKESNWVDMEWRYALKFKGEEAIEPIPIDPPDICPPPVELQKKHFNDKMLFIIRASQSMKVD